MGQANITTDFIPYFNSKERQFEILMPGSCIHVFPTYNFGKRRTKKIAQGIAYGLRHQLALYGSEWMRERYVIKAAPRTNVSYFWLDGSITADIMVGEDVWFTISRETPSETTKAAAELVKTVCSRIKQFGEEAARKSFPLEMQGAA